jgi:peptidoglycan/LPS O-acetylase OafA/YrhL
MKLSSDAPNHESGINLSHSKSSSNSIDALLILRALACFIVVSIHCEPPRQALFWKKTDLTWILFGNAWVAVWVFFCLSGYLIGKSFYSRRYTPNYQGIIKFFKDYALRVFPLYYFSVFVVTFFIYPEILKHENLSILIHVLTFTYSPFLTPEGFNYNISIWLLSTICQFCLVAPLVYAVFRNKCKTLRECMFYLLLTIGAVLSLKLGIYLVIKTEIHNSIYVAGRFWYTPMISSLDVFVIGFLINPVIFHLRKISCRIFNQDRPSLYLYLIHLQALKALAVVFLGVLYLFTAHHFYSQELIGIPDRWSIGIISKMTLFFFQPLTAMVVSLFIIAFEFDNSQPSRATLSYENICSRPLRCLEVFGNISYGIYIWHYPILQKITFLFSRLRPLDAFFMRLLGTCTLAFLLATITYYLVELPASRYKLNQ